MEWLIEKIIESGGSDSYSPEQIKQMLDYHQELLNHHQELIVYSLGGIGFLAFLCIAVYIIFTLRFNKLEKKFTKISGQRNDSG